MAAADLIGDVCSSHFSASHSINSSSVAGSDDDKLLVAGKDTPLLGVAGYSSVALSVVEGAVPS